MFKKHAVLITKEEIKPELSNMYEFRIVKNSNHCIHT